MLMILFAILGVFGVAFIGQWVQQVRHDARPVDRPTPGQTAIGFGTNFFDTLGIGSFAPTTALYKLFRVIPDEEIPGTLNVGHTPPVLLQVPIFFTIVAIDHFMLASWIGAAVLGAWLGAGVVARLPRRKIQLGMGIALFAAAVFFSIGLLGLYPVGGEARGVGGMALVVACTFSFVFGSLMTIGVGIYAPTMIVVTLLGMHPETAFPLMMGAAGFLMPVSSIRFLQARRYNLRAALGLAIGGLPAVLVAAFVVKSMDLALMRTLVVFVVLYTSLAMLRSAGVVTMSLRYAAPMFGAVAGALVGFLQRPAVPEIGQLPIGAVLTRGATLDGSEQLLVSAAQTSANYMLAGAVLGAVLGFGIALLLERISRTAPPVAVADPEVRKEASLH
jgi:uncharacterized membrane protein YfcA